MTMLSTTVLEHNTFTSTETPRFLPYFVNLVHPPPPRCYWDDRKGKDNCLSTCYSAAYETRTVALYNLGSGS